MNSTIYTNMDSVRNYNVFNNNASNASRAMERATTGLKIASAKDNASQYAISEKMLERINSNNQASQNVQNDNALTRTASGALANTIDILNSLKAKAIDAANDSNTDADRLNIQKDVDKLIAQIDHNANTAKFNGKALIDGSLDEKVNNATKTAFTLDMAANQSGQTIGDVLGLSGSQTAKLSVSWADAKGNITVADTGYTGITSGVTIDTILTNQANSSFTGGDITSTGVNATITTDKNNNNITATAAGYKAVSSGTGQATRFSGLTIKITSNADASKSVSYTFSNLIQRGKDVNANATPLTFQIGETSGMSTELEIEDMSAKGLGISQLSVKTRAKAEASISAIDTAISAALQQQTSLGAMEARLGFTADTLDTINENLQASTSAIRDADMAKEVSNYMKWNVLMQSSQYMLAQSNQNAFSVLNLLQ